MGDDERTTAPTTVMGSTVGRSPTGPVGPRVSEWPSGRRTGFSTRAIPTTRVSAPSAWARPTLVDPAWPGRLLVRPLTCHPGSTGSWRLNWMR